MKKLTINIIDKMIELSEGKKRYLTEILRLTKKQKGFIENEDMDELNKIMSEKEKLMESIDLLDVDFLSLYKEIGQEENIDTIDKINSIKYNNLGELQGIIGNINIILSNISVIDNQNTEIMKNNLENIKSGLRHVKEVKKAYKGYNYEMAGSILIDEKK